MKLCEFTAVELVEELRKREGITEEVAEPHRPFRLQLGEQELKSTGPAVILIIRD